MTPLTFSVVHMVPTNGLTKIFKKSTNKSFFFLEWLILSLFIFLFTGTAHASFELGTITATTTLLFPPANREDMEENICQKKVDIQCGPSQLCNSDGRLNFITFYS